jgi:SEC-C motif
MKQRVSVKGDLQPADVFNYLDPNDGVIVQATYWRPRISDAHPEQPGEKVMILSYLPKDAEDPCPCGSGKRFGACCRPLPYWRPVCPNPGMQGFNLMHPQSARFTNVPVDEVYKFLQDDKRLYCTEDTPQRAFWAYWGDPALDTRHGRLCFGDFELQEDQTLLITALSDTRMEILLELVRPLNLGSPQIHQDPLPQMDKPVRKVPARRRRRRS